MTAIYRFVRNPFLRWSFYSLSVVLVALCQGRISRAEVILDNTSTATASSGTVSLSATGWESLIFTSHANLTPTSLTMLTVWTGSGSTTATITVSLYGVGANDLPTGSALATSTVTGVTVVPSTTFTTADAYEMNLTTSSTGSWSMLSGTKYAVVLSADRVYRLPVYADNPSTTNGTWIGRSYSPTSGSSWNALQLTTIPFFKLDATPVPVPEPSTCILCFSAGVVALVSKKRILKRA